MPHTPPPQPDAAPADADPQSAPERPAAEPTLLEQIRIPLSDGCELSARVWLPADAGQHPVPAVLEYIPYRLRDHKALRDARIHGWFARHGYAAVRVDLRGSGDSDGVLRDEYLQQELDDGLEVLRWIGAQPWCSGKVGLFGLSWGGFNGLQLAALRPPELGAVISVCSSDDRYADDVHYMGGCLLTDNLSWASTMFAFNSCPPDPAVVGERWRELWLERLEGSGLWLKQWLTHQRRDAFWRHASVCEDYGAIQVPVMAVSGWADGYSNTVFRLLAHLSVPRRGLVGPWGHKYPHMGGPGPAIDFLGECLRWWDQWLKGIDRGLEHEPMLRAWMHDRRDPLHPQVNGRWVAEARWPSPRIEARQFALTRRTLVPVASAGGAAPEGAAARAGFPDPPAGLAPAPEPKPEPHAQPEARSGSAPAPEPEPPLMLQSPLSVGLFGGKWCSYAESTDLPSDQRLEDGGALIFDTEPLPDGLDILGSAQVELELSADRPVAMVAVRLSDLDPSDRATRVTYGVLNLTHRDSHETPAPLEPDRRYRVQLRLNEVCQRFHAGHRIRLAISSSYWPLAWPSPEPVRLTLYPGGCRLQLPVRPARAEDAGLRPLGRPQQAPAPAHTMVATARREWEVRHNLATNEVALEVVNDDPRIRLDDIGLTFAREVRERYSFRNNRYDSLRGEVTHVRRFERDDWRVRTVTRTVLTSTPEHFVVRATLDAYEGDVRVFARSWDERLLRDLI